MPRNPFSKYFRTGVDKPYVRPSLERSESIDSIESDATAPNNPGPGRNVGRLYDTLGTRFEHFLKHASSAGRETRGANAHLGLQLVRVESHESIASDATGPNNPGPGRNLGRLLDAIGGRIETLLNNRAGGLKLAPYLLAQQIRGLRHYDYTSSGRKILGFPGIPTDEEHAELKTLCRKLLKHCKSHVLATQLEALDEVIVLATDDPIVRQVLAQVLHDSYLIPKYKESDLQILSSKATISIKDGEVHEFWWRFTLPSVYATTIRRSSEAKMVYEHGLALYFRDPNVSFLLGRLLCREFNRFSPFLADHLFFFQSVCLTYIKIAIQNPQVIEWETLRRIFVLVFMQTIVDDVPNSTDSIVRLAHHFPIFQIYESNLPRHWDPGAMNGSDDLRGIIINSHWIVKFLRDLSMSEDLFAQLWRLRNMDAKSRESVRGTVFGSEILIAYAHAHHTNNCSFCLNRRIRQGSYFAPAAVMFKYYLHGTPTERALAEAVISKSNRLNRYFKHTFISLASNASIGGHSVDLPSFPGEPLVIQSASSPDIRDHIRRRDFFKGEDLTFEENSDMNEDNILFPPYNYKNQSELWLWLEVDGENQPLDVTGHYPVLAGRDNSGEEVYIARIDSFHTYGYVKQGARAISVKERYGKKKKVVNRFEVMVMKHDPCDVHVEAIPKDTKFQSGPFYWIRGKPAERIPRRRVENTDASTASKPATAPNSRSKGKTKESKFEMPIPDDCLPILRCSM